jgi:hypothetical protein
MIATMLSRHLADVNIYTSMMIVTTTRICVSRERDPAAAAFALLAPNFQRRPPSAALEEMDGQFSFFSTWCHFVSFAGIALGSYGYCTPPTEK